MSASWNGKTALSEADAKPGRYYVTCRDSRGRTAYLLGPFTQQSWGKDAHARALGMVRDARRLTIKRYADRDTAFATWGTAWLPLIGTAPAGLLNNDLLS